MSRSISLMILALLICGLGLGQAAPLSAAAENNSLERGRQLYAAGEIDHALAVLRAYARQSEITAQAVPAYALIGRILVERQDYAGAVLYLQRIPPQLRDPQVRLLLGRALVASGSTGEGLKLLRPLLGEDLSPEERQQLLTSLTSAALETGQYLPALFYLQQQLSNAENPEPLLTEAHQVLQNHCSDAELSEAAFMWQGTPLGQDALLQLARRALVQQQPEQARRYLQQIFNAQTSFAYEQQADQLWQRTNADNWLNRDSIGVLLPLSGSYASYGELVKKGLELALKEHNKTHLPIRFIYRDTALEGVSAAQLVSQLSDDDRVMAVIGPLLASVSGEAARRAQSEMVPILALSQTQELPEIGNFVFRDTLTAKQQVRALVQRAMANNNLSFSVLHPDNRLGQRMTEAFVAEVERVGGEIVDIVSYPEGSTDFREPIQRLLWEDQERPLLPQQPVVDPETGEVLEVPVPELDYPLPPFHALFIPDYADRISMIAPQLMFYGIKDVLLLGINGWNSEQLIERAGRFLGQALFVDAFFLDTERPAARRFVELYRQTYDEDPSVLEAQAYDAANLLLQVLDDPAVTNRGDVRKQLAGLREFQGVTGTRRFDRFGEAVKDLYLLGVERGRITEYR